MRFFVGAVFGRPLVKRFAPCYQTVVLSVSSVLYVTSVYCGQTDAWIKMKLGTQVGLSPGHIALDGDTVPLHKGAQPPMFGPYLLRPNGCMDQHVNWYNARPRPRRLCVRWGPSHLLKRGRSPI